MAFDQYLLKDLPVSIIDGDRGKAYPKRSEFTNSGHCLFLNAGNVTSTGFDFSDCSFISEERHSLLRKGTLQRGDSVLTTRGTVGNVSFYSDSVPFEIMRINSGMVIFRCDETVLDPLFFYWFLRSSRFSSQVELLTTGSAQPQLPIRDIKEISVSLPKLLEQKAIAHILGTLEDKIELNRKTNETLEDIAKALFKSWFVDFDPVRAKVEGRPTGLPYEIDELFPDSFEESELGEIPSGWRAASIYEISKVVYGAPFSSKLFNTAGKGIPLARIRDLKTGSPGVYTEETHPKGCLIEPGDSVVGMDGEFRPYLWSSEKCWMNQRVCKFVPSRRESNNFVRQSIARPLMDVELSETATTVIHLGKSDIDRFQIVIPSKEVLEIFDSVASPIEASVVSGNQQNTILSSLRDALLPRLISGELRVSDAVKMLEEVGI